MSYFSALIIISAASGMACLLVPDENSPGGRMLTTFAALCVLFVAMSPVWTARERVSAALASFEEFVNSGTDADTESSADRAVASELSSAIAARVCEHFSLPAGRVRVSVTLDTSDPTAPKLASSHVCITGGEGSPHPDDVAAFVKELTGTEASAVVLAPP